MAFGMTLSIVQQNGYPLVGGAVPPVQIADKTFTTAIVTTTPTAVGFGVTRIRCVIYLKTLVLGATTTAAAGPVFYLRGATVVGMTTGLVHLTALAQAPNIASSTAATCIVLDAVVPVSAVTFLDVACDPTLMGAGSSGTFDALLTFEP